MKTIIKLFLMSHGIPVAVKTADAMIYYRSVARFHGHRLENRRIGFVFS